MTIELGANVKSQAVCFALCFAIGLVCGIVALLYFRKSGRLERALTDFFATVVIGAIFILCVEYVMQGAIRFYGICAFFVGTAGVPFIYSKVKRRKARSKIHKK